MTIWIVGAVLYPTTLMNMYCFYDLGIKEIPIDEQNPKT